MNVNAYDRFCSRRKIRCSRDLPECSTCKVHKQTCSYTKSTASDSNALRAVSSSSPAAHEPNLVPDHDEKALATIRFLDHELFLRSLRGATPSLRVAVCVPGYVKQLVLEGSLSQRIMTSYYQSVHQWLPIVSKKKVYERLLNPLLPARVDSAFLLLCMSLLTSSCTGIQDPDVLPEYCAAIKYCTEIQRSGLITPEVLQGCILLSVYEWGHAIYPAADLSISMCLRYALSLEMGWEVARGGGAKSMWADGEEERRTWWAVYILERIAGLGRPRQIMLVPEAEMSAILPCHDNDWEDQKTPEAYYTLSSPPESLGRYASTVQACYLLSCVYRHTSDTSISVSSRPSELDQLDKTLSALIQYSAETQTGGIYSILCYQTAVSFWSVSLARVP
ncbi:hypothetical protein M431DRAFT_326191 [Trichoderma harzianum CBS 226.95]|uniref:Zn(2)-C6 fungal-type domain-containing protein n=1 Tax=Trichoderma harzianum CBS 226.95 TaxID=983964 RepID=A0A2T3ZU91_TRIHA|nr:hypothetical protein M431DRAFT_326191 [Trichoderma harzianum CBS 226.95]PTB48368.1 hypothetical protein M431DRAFT_326191 [Trichoderma harzianum CBS 226.95]